MKKRILIIRLLVLAFLLIGLSSFLKMGKDKFVQIEPNLFASRYEVTNSEFREFLSENQTGKALYDSTQWLRKFPFSYNQPLVNFYHWHPAYNQYPVVNITRETAEAYCKWLTSNYNSDSHRKYKKVVFRLPSEAEWVRFSGPMPTSVLASDKKTALANLKMKDQVLGQDDYKFDGSIYTSEVGSFKANSFGLFDIVGNAYELTSEGVQKGGSWDNYLEDCSADKASKLQLPDPRVGFRVVMEIIEE